MNAIVCREHGPPDVMKLQQVPRPEPGEGQLVIDAEAIGVNFVDTMRRSGRHPAAPPVPFTPGIEVCGRVAEVGPGISGLTRGQRVIGRTVTGGAYAEAVLVEAQFTVPCPEHLSPETAAAIFVNGQTAWHALHTMGRLKPGEWVLVTAAAGGVGTWAVQLAARAGAKVVAAAGSPEKCELALRLGATAAANYREPAWHDAVVQATGGKGVDLILESVGGQVATGCLRCWAAGGRIVIYGEASGEPARIPGDVLLFGNRAALGLAVGTVIQDEPLMREAMSELLEAVGAGLQVPIGGTYPLAQAAQAHADLESRRTHGKLVLFP